MKLMHHSQKKEYRNPTGAVKTDSSVTLCLLAEEAREVFLRLFDCGEVSYLPMAQTKENHYEITISVGEKPRLLWYDFQVCGAFETVYLKNQEDGLGGEGIVCTEAQGKPFQITVYDKDYQTPDWFKGKVMYQIFPDRFYGVHPLGERYKKRPEYAIHYDWYEGLKNQRHPVEDGPACNDFYGGNLKGIREKLPYLASLGVEVVYVNPIFDAYSNHKYDTADYKTIDPMFGTEEDFENLCKEAEALGIRIILDGVFSHTGADSIYFNKYGNYGEHTGAYRDWHSPYRSWYQFTDYPNYQSWWGCTNLPNVNEMEPAYLDYMLRDEDAVVKKWLKKGAFGWRLDVADELPDEFIKTLRQEVKKENPQAVVIGEVWEDASNKIAYSEQREYLLGHELDSVMNYPFKDHVLAFLMQWEEAEQLNRHILSQMENYPKETLHALMNIIGTHDTMRAKSLLGGMDENCGDAKMSSGLEELATARLKLAAFMQMTFYGVPCIYYGDEVGMEGGKDPYNRGTYPWRHVDSDLRAWYETLGNLRKNNPVLQLGDLTPLYAKGDVYVYARHDEKGAFALCAVNRSFEERVAEVDFSAFAKVQLSSLSDGRLTLAPLSAEIFFL